MIYFSLYDLIRRKMIDSYVSPFFEYKSPNLLRVSTLNWILVSFLITYVYYNLGVFKSIVSLELIEASCSTNRRYS
jgi:hypothetical protein